MSDLPAQPVPSRPRLPSGPELVADAIIAPPLRAEMAAAGRDELIDVQIELRLRHPDGVEGAAAQVIRSLPENRRAGVRVLRTSVVARLTADEIRALAEADAGRADPDPAAAATTPAARYAIHRIWPNFRTGPLITRSVVTTKCQAVHRAFNATGRDIVWAVLDSGIDRNHPHFARHGNLAGDLHRSFVPEEPDPLVDDAGHGTHVAGILAGEQIAADPVHAPLRGVVAYWDEGFRELRRRAVTMPSICGMAPECRLISCKVLRADETGDVAMLTEALEYLVGLNKDGRDLRVHGVNISVGYPFDPSWFATGLSPICREVDNLVRSGVVVVIAAGNTGYGSAVVGLDTAQRIQLGYQMTINDPGNAALALTVGSTSSSPHSTGVSYFSSKGPTGDGRMKPDLVAPGERVISAAAGRLATTAAAVDAGATYAENSGTSMAAPHVSGAAAAFLSVHREFLGQPDAVRRALLSTATDLGRAATFQGAGLLDAMRAIQSV